MKRIGISLVIFGVCTSFSAYAAESEPTVIVKPTSEDQTMFDVYGIALKIHTDSLVLLSSAPYQSVQTFHTQALLSYDIGAHIPANIGRVPIPFNALARGLQAGMSLSPGGRLGFDLSSGVGFGGFSGHGGAPLWRSHLSLSGNPMGTRRHALLRWRVNF
jgi:hypothetical protein